MTDDTRIISVTECLSPFRLWVAENHRAAANAMDTTSLSPSFAPGLPTNPSQSLNVVRCALNVGRCFLCTSFSVLCSLNIVRSSSPNNEHVPALASVLFISRRGAFMPASRFALAFNACAASHRLHRSED
jgi:hypothetical protein